MSEDWLKRWYKSRFSQSSAEGLKDDVWEKINSRIGNWSEFWYTSNSESIDLKPKAEVWENISAGLAVNAPVSNTSRLFWMRAASIAAVFILIPYLLSDLQIVDRDLAASSQVQSTSTNTSNSNLAIPSLFQSFDSKPNTVVTISQTVLEPLRVFPSVQIARSEPVPELTSTKVNPSQKATDQSLRLATLPLNASSRFERDLNFERLNGKPTRGPWSVGASINMQRSNMLNAVSLRGMSNESPITNISHTKIGLNLSVIRQLRSGANLEAKLLINNQESQCYEDFAGANYIEKSLVLNYQTLQLSYAHPLFTLGKSRLEASAGIFGSYRTSLEEKWDKEDRNILANGFKKGNVGIRFGLDGVYSINQLLDFSIGVYYNNGIINVFKGTDDIPSHFLKTYTSSFGANIGLRYHL
ncbi:MAG: hypothetical protein ACJA1C_000408 [Crocinitomicaceae bacterium]|jgi:hypothetical protein